jgi:hypothetical protein
MRRGDGRRRCVFLSPGGARAPAAQVVGPKGCLSAARAPFRCAQKVGSAGDVSRRPIRLLQAPQHRGGLFLLSTGPDRIGFFAHAVGALAPILEKRHTDPGQQAQGAGPADRAYPQLVFVQADIEPLMTVAFDAPLGAPHRQQPGGIQPAGRAAGDDVMAGSLGLPLLGDGANEQRDLRGTRQPELGRRGFTDDDDAVFETAAALLSRLGNAVEAGFSGLLRGKGPLGRGSERFSAGWVGCP